jgi:hypothetical protein
MPIISYHLRFLAEVSKQLEQAEVLYLVLFFIRHLVLLRLYGILNSKAKGKQSYPSWSPMWVKSWDYYHLSPCHPFTHHRCLGLPWRSPANVDLTRRMKVKLRRNRSAGLRQRPKQQQPNAFIRLSCILFKLICCSVQTNGLKFMVL